MTATEIILVRHGETEFNADGRLQGHRDSPLTEVGSQQAAALARRLGSIAIDALYSSDLGRAVATAVPASEAIGRPATVCKELRERNLGAFEGLTWSEITLQQPDAHASYRSDPNFAPLGGESLRQLYDRGVAAFESIAAVHSGERVAIVTHGGLLACLFRFFAAQPLADRRRVRLPNAAINIVQWDPEGWVIRTWGDTSHLDQLPCSD